ncbi:MAG: hypothetical protein AAFN05_12585, partial [Pseudomonadota bacterium]
IDPRCNIWDAAAPVVEEWIRDRLGPRQAARDAREMLMVLSRLGPRLPGVAEELVMLAEEARTKRLRGPVSIAVREFPRARIFGPGTIGFLVGLLAAAIAASLLG